MEQNEEKQTETNNVSPVNKTVGAKPKMRLKDLQKWQLKKLLTGFCTAVIVSVIFLGYASYTLYTDKKSEDYYWTSNLTQPQEEIDRAAAKSAGAANVTVGTYVETVKEINLKTSSFRVVMQVWFKWSGHNDINMIDNFHVYNGTINSQTVMKESHKNGEHYQLLRCDISVSKSYWTVRFPLESHQLRLYVESEYPVNTVTFTADKKNSTVNENLSSSGFDLMRNDVGVYFKEYSNTHSDPELNEPITTAEFVTAMEFNRSSAGLYVKCFIALLGTITWVLIALFLCTYHRVDPLNLIPAALFGTVTNIMVGANILPDALQMGMLEYVNIWGIMTILAVTLSIININRIRNKNEDRHFAAYFGRVMFFTILFFNILGNVLMPLCAYRF